MQEPKIVNYFEKNLTDLINAINQLISERKTLVNMKMLRSRMHIDSMDKSAINFIWHNLKLLEKRGIGYYAADTKFGMKLFKLPSEKIDSETILARYKNG